MKVIALMVSLLLAHTTGLALEERVEKELDLGSGKQVIIDNTNGNVTVHGWDQNKVKLVAIKKTKGGQEALDNWEIQVNTTAQGATIKAHSLKKIKLGRNVSIDMEIWVPKETHLNASTTNGDMAAQAVKGATQLESTNGNIDATAMAGSITAETTNGNVSVALVEHDGGALSLETTNGNVDLHAPASLKGNVDADTVNGSITSSLAMTVTKQSRTRLAGQINGGGAEIALETVNGSISLDAI